MSLPTTVEEVAGGAAFSPIDRAGMDPSCCRARASFRPMLIMGHHYYCVPSAHERNKRSFTWVIRRGMPCDQTRLSVALIDLPGGGFDFSASSHRWHC
jgi:hypothetical protein